MIITIVANFFIGTILGPAVDECAAMLRFALQAIASFCTFIFVVNSFILPQASDEASSELNKEVPDDE
jgi:hypothetical protein